jgi:cytosine/adenosine deaminase-related metal-dependent hydrolase
MSTGRGRWILGGKALRRVDGKWVLQERGLKNLATRLRRSHISVRGPGPNDVNAGDRTIIPGVVNAHAHSVDSFRRGMFDMMPRVLRGSRKVPIRRGVRSHIVSHP